MKTMTCNQLGGACELEFHAETFEAIAEMSKAHGTQMFMSNDAVHLQAMNEMQELMKSPEAMQTWFDKKRNEFDNLSDD